MINGQHSIVNFELDDADGLCLHLSFSGRAGLIHDEERASIHAEPKLFRTAAR